MSRGQQPDENERLCFQQICDMARHYSNLRFAMFAVSIGIIGGLLTVDFGEPFSIPEGSQKALFRLAALIVTILFAAGEWRVAELVVFYQEQAKDFREFLRLPLPPGHALYKWLVRVVMLAPLVFASMYWIVTLLVWLRQ